MSLAHFRQNPRYGTGTYRRLVRLSKRRERVVATLDDTHHAMTLDLRHHAGSIVDVEGRIERGPASSCAMAGAALRNAVGVSLDAFPTVAGSLLATTSNCTHLLDLLHWAVRAATEQVDPEVEYEVRIPDFDSGTALIDVARNGRIVHQWKVDDQSILAPREFVDRPLFGGFRSWARVAFKGDVLEAATVLQRGFWVARGRRYVVDEVAMPLRHADGMRNACFSYSGDNWDAATSNIGYVRDFTAGVVEHDRTTKTSEREHNDAT